MQTYIAVVEKDADSAFGLWFPDLEGCFSAADTQDDILPNAIQAVTFHLEGAEAPKARAVDMIAQVADVQEALAGGAYLLAVPHVTITQRAARVNISLDKGTLSAIDATAKTRGLTRSAFIAEAALNEIQGRAG